VSSSAANAGLRAVAPIDGSPFDPSAYDQIVFDCDGVLFASNGVKAANIRAAAARFCDGPTVDGFVEYFTANNGVPREVKIHTFFDDPTKQVEILAEYNRLNAATLPGLDPEPAAVQFLDACAALDVPIYLLSGGDTSELEAVLGSAGLTHRFVAIMGGPADKSSHLERLALRDRTCFFGDSKHDHEIAERFGFDFVFVSRHTQFRGWREYFQGRPQVRTIPDFEALLG
jgi:phosphoglycolate phosphatase-like HAD superfamily hydrolase